MELQFTFRAEKQQEIEKYPNLPVLTYIGGDKTSKFKLNRKACELLGYENKVTSTINFGITSTKQLFLANTNSTVEEGRCNITLQKDFASGKFLERLNKHFNQQFSEGKEFVLATVDQQFGDFKVLLISGDSPNSMTTDDFSQFPDNAFEEEYLDAKEVSVL